MTKMTPIVVQKEVVKATDDFLKLDPIGRRVFWVGQILLQLHQYYLSGDEKYLAEIMYILADMHIPEADDKPGDYHIGSTSKNQSTESED
ncbi:MAG: hypothetical protein ACI39E_02985 [Acutalibacteraceae bacterium]